MFKNIQFGRVQQHKFWGKLDSTVKFFLPPTMTLNSYWFFIFKIENDEADVSALRKYSYSKMINVSLSWHKIFHE